jgi:hypothetical protein
MSYINVRETEGVIKIGQSRETGNVGYTRHKTRTNKAKYTTQYVLDTTIHKTQDEEKQNKKHNTIYAGRQHTQGEDKETKNITQYVMHI